MLRQLHSQQSQRATCIIATDYGYMDNVCPVASGGQYGARVSLVQASICFVAGCKIYNSCTQAYEYPACGCKSPGATLRRKRKLWA